jgi:hypothetical protein
MGIIAASRHTTLRSAPLYPSVAATRLRKSIDSATCKSSIAETHVLIE